TPSCRPDEDHAVMTNEAEHAGEVVGARIISKILEDEHAFAEAVVSGTGKDVTQDVTKDAASPTAKDLIKNGQEFKGSGGRSGSKFPDQGPPGGVLYRRDPQTGAITHYIVYDQNGYPLRRIDITGRPHGGVPTPHVLEYDRNVNPQTGQVYVRPQKHVRPARPEEIP